MPGQLQVCPDVVAVLVFTADTIQDCSCSVVCVLVLVHFDNKIIIIRLEELRRLNYSLDVELQRERTGRLKLEEKVMSPRSAQASRMLPQSDSSDR